MFACCQGWPSAATLDIGRVGVSYRMQLGESGYWQSQPLVARVLRLLCDVSYPNVNCGAVCVLQSPVIPPLTLSWSDVPPTMTINQLVPVWTQLQLFRYCCTALHAVF